MNTLQNRIRKLKALIKQRLPKSDFEKQYMRWVNDDGDNTLRLNYDLNEESIVFDVGGYQGQWTNSIFSKYGCFVYVFEPVNEFANFIKHRFSENKKIRVYPFGLASKNESIEISISKDASSIFRDDSEKELVKLMSIDEFWHQCGIEHIALMKVNIEGGEYELVEQLIRSGYIQRIGNLQVQFHKFVPNAKSRMEAIQRDLTNTHCLTYQYRFIWESWQRNSQS